MIPTVECDRLILRGMTKEDFPTFASIWQEPEVLRFIGKKPRSESESWGVFLRIAGSWAIEGFGQWAITRKSDGVFIGQTGFFNARREIGKDFDEGPETGWVLTAAAQGHGFGLEAAEAAHRWFDAQSFGRITHAMIEVGHGSSFSVAKRLGYLPIRETEDLGDPVILLRREYKGQ